MTNKLEQTQFVQTDWRQKILATPVWKRRTYQVVLPALSWLARRHIGPEYTVPPLERVLGERGMPIEARRAWANRSKRIAGATLLVQGTGTGWDVVSWARFRPRRIFATDMFSFPEWPDVADHVKRKYGVEVIFTRGSLEHLEFATNSIDLVVSDAVFEHCTDIQSVLSETRRVIRSDGIVYATYGPLWYSAGGDHFSGRGGLSNAYNHVALSSADYKKYFQSNLQSREDYQSGGRYVALALFSKLTTRQYLRAFDEARLSAERLILEVSSDALAYKRAYPSAFANLLSRLVDVSSDDLMIKANFVILRPQ